MSTTRLHEYTKDEWFDIARKLKPGLSEAEYDVMWNDFQIAKAEHIRKRGLN